MPGLFAVLLAYVFLSALLLVVLLFGQHPSCRALGRAHSLLTEALPAGIRRAARLLCGLGGEAQLERLEEYCCYSSNPVVQALFVVLLFASYYLYAREIFAFLPQPWAPAWHEHTAALAIGGVLLAFWRVSASDPGRISVHNQADFAAMYPHSPDGSSSNETCQTCERPRLARARHCPLCKRCIARFDHHCSWVRASPPTCTVGSLCWPRQCRRARLQVNNCIGLLNLRLFLLFLASLTLLCCYGLALGCLVLQGVLQQSGLLDTPFWDRSSGRVILLREPSWANRLRLAQIVAARFSLQAVLLLFLALSGACVACFLAFHLWLIATNTTTYESIRRRQARAAAAAARADAGRRTRAQALVGALTCGCLGDGGATSGHWTLWDRGWAANFSEVLAPRRTLRARLKRL